MRLIVKYSREDRIRFISHLDLMRTFHRALRRAALPVAFSQGFNPHPKMAFASALPVGMTSQGEYMDIMMEDHIEPHDFCSAMNTALPCGTRMLQGVEVGLEMPSLMSMIERASYSIILPIIGVDIEAGLKGFLEQPFILVTKAGKSGVQHMNIRPLIHWMKSRQSDNGGTTLDILLNSGSKSNLKPELLLNSFLEYIIADSDAQDYCEIRRTDMYICRNDRWITPLELMEVFRIG